MDKVEQKLTQYLIEARAMEHALVRVLQTQIAMTPRGSYRSALENHLEETRRHADQVNDRLRTLDPGFNPVTTIVGFWQDVLGQTLALSKAPLDMLRGTGGEEKVLKNAKDACASESLEIATYTTIERVAGRVGDQQTAELAAGILVDEQRMLARVIGELPGLADAVVGAEVEDEPSYDGTETGAADAARATVQEAEAAAQTAAGQKPWAGYDEQSVADIQARLAGADDDLLRFVRDYERAHDGRATVLAAADRHLTT
jgi:ferritin-like metal-binding protein YciE